MSKENRVMRGTGPDPGRHMVIPGEKAKNFKGTLKRLLGYLNKYSFNIIMVFVMTIMGTLFSTVSPKLMGNST